MTGSFYAMSTEKRARQKAGTQARRDAAREVAARAKKRRRIVRVGLVVVAVVGVFLAITLSGRDDEPEVTAPPPPVGADVVAAAAGDAADNADDAADNADDAAMSDDEMTGAPDDAEDTSDAAATEGGETTGEADDPTETDLTDDEVTGESSAEDTASEVASTGGANYTPYAPGDYGTEPCAPAGGVSEPVLDFAGAPMACIDTSVPHTAVFDTSRGVVRVALDVTNTPGTVNSFVNLARFGYYDDTLVHRSAPSIGILQGGSPHTNSAADPGPGYTLWDEGTGFTYRPGQLVMARRGEPNSAGAQYFFTVTPDAGLLDGQGTYVVFGDVVEGLDVLTDILDSHVDIPDNPLGGAPVPPVVVNSVSIEAG